MDLFLLSHQLMEALTSSIAILIYIYICCCSLIGFICIAVFGVSDDMSCRHTRVLCVCSLLCVAFLRYI